MSRDGEARRRARIDQQLGRVKATLRERDARIAELEKRIAVLEGSTALQFGKLVAGAARSPRSGRRLPRELYRLWRERHAPIAAARTSGGARLERGDRPEDRLLVAGPCDTMIVAGVLGAGTAELLAGHARIVPLYPHDATTVLQSADLDAVVVDTTAGEPGGAWAYLGVPGMYDRDLALHEIRRIAAARALPLVLYGTTPPATLACLTWDARLSDPDGLAGLLAPVPLPGGVGGRPLTEDK